MWHASLSHFVVEQPKSARHFLATLNPEQPIQSLHFATLNEHTSANELPELLSPLLAGHDVGLLSEAGCPGIADPGADLVNLAHRNGIRVVPLVGPSSILLALMASGLNGQCFAFHGYLPIAEARKKQGDCQAGGRILQNCKQTQLFIETPYRNDRLCWRPARPVPPGNAAVRRHRHNCLPGEQILTRSIAAVEIPACPAT